MQFLLDTFSIEIIAWISFCEIPVQWRIASNAVAPRKKCHLFQSVRSKRIIKITIRIRRFPFIQMWKAGTWEHTRGIPTLVRWLCAKRLIMFFRRFLSGTLANTFIFYIFLGYEFFRQCVFSKFSIFSCWTKELLNSSHHLLIASTAWQMGRCACGDMN